jgi:hypothetical protein
MVSTSNVTHALHAVPDGAATIISILSPAKATRRVDVDIAVPDILDISPVPAESVAEVVADPTRE